MRRFEGSNTLLLTNIHLASNSSAFISMSKRLPTLDTTVTTSPEQVQGSLERSSPFSFLRLPLELRRLVYKDLLVAGAVSIALRPNEWSIYVNVLRISKQIYAETRPILYDANCFFHLSDVGGRLGPSFWQEMGAKSVLNRSHGPCRLPIETGGVLLSLAVLDFSPRSRGHLDPSTHEQACQCSHINPAPQAQ